jgi:hypothetical protein
MKHLLLSSILDKNMTKMSVTLDKNAAIMTIVLDKIAKIKEFSFFAAGCCTLFTYSRRGIPWDSVQHFKPKRVLTRLYPETNENRHNRTAQHIGPPCHGVIDKNEQFRYDVAFKNEYGT